MRDISEDPQLGFEDLPELYAHARKEQGESKAEQMVGLIRCGYNAKCIMQILHVKPYRFRQILRSRRVRERLALDEELSAVQADHQCKGSVGQAMEMLTRLAVPDLRPETARKAAGAILRHADQARKRDAVLAAGSSDKDRHAARSPLHRTAPDPVPWATDGLPATEFVVTSGVTDLWPQVEITLSPFYSMTVQDTRCHPQADGPTGQVLGGVFAGQPASKSPARRDESTQSEGNTPKPQTPTARLEGGTQNMGECGPKQAASGRVRLRPGAPSFPFATDVQLGGIESNCRGRKYLHGDAYGLAPARNPMSLFCGGWHGGRCSPPCPPGTNPCRQTAADMAPGPSRCPRPAAASRFPSGRGGTLRFFRDFGLARGRWGGRVVRLPAGARCARSGGRPGGPARRLPAGQRAAEPAWGRPCSTEKGIQGIAW